MASPCLSLCGMRHLFLFRFNNIIVTMQIEREVTCHDQSNVYDENDAGKK